jgi:hypothetical protein
MLTDQCFLRLEASASDAKGQLPIRTSAEFVGTYHAQAYEIVDAITAAIMNAEAGLNWLSAEPPDLEQVRQTLNSIAGNGKRAAEIIVRLRTLVGKVPGADKAGARTDGSEAAGAT